MSLISIKQLLEAGVHFGHQTHRWNPKMKEFIFGERNGIYIIDLQKTLRLFKDAVNFIATLSTQGKIVLFVGTKAQAREAVEEEALRCGMYYVNNRWLGGLLTNFSTIQIGIKRYKELESMKANGFYDKLSKKEVARLERERKKLEKNLRGIRDMDRLPDAVFIVDSGRETIAVREAAKLGIPVIAIVDTNCDPDSVDFVIPGNDDALRSVRLFSATIADAILAGREVYQAEIEARRREAEERAAKEAAARKAAREAERKRKADQEEKQAAAAAKEAAAKSRQPEQAPEAAPEQAPPAAAKGAKGAKKAAVTEEGKAEPPATEKKAATPKKAVAKPKKAAPKAKEKAGGDKSAKTDKAPKAGQETKEKGD